MNPPLTLIFSRHVEVLDANIHVCVLMSLGDTSRETERETQFQTGPTSHHAEWHGNAARVIKFPAKSDADERGKRVAVRKGGCLSI